ncbi:precorrin-2 C(20)-methyltransferase [Desulfallas sp. Bu1-1]|uniref:precorrin-2 C(20)-methyltransferase n=1 Tax=Desulfallas sp. Bu1-1 TaxID=2787620 RepID=UPI0018A09B6A|nr:precorrin-2 C(20)-methyltransferase [Desulfallas sp. Bu1-1]MBF7083291.1 precorrin-2 C(20)-methyltransferase [Desulfallas sp. Bu1-1]
MSGIFYGIGVGPGDPDLLTIKAKKILSDVDLLCVPKSRQEKESLALAVVKAVVPKEHKLLELEFPMSRDRSVLEKSWREAGQLVAEALLSGRNVAFITVGDPTLYSTYGYLLRYIKANYPEISTETVPGVSSITACPAFIQEPLVEGEEKLAVIPAAYSLEDLQKIMEIFDTVVLMKVNKRLPELMQYFRQSGNVETYFVSRCGYSNQFATNRPEQVMNDNLDYMSLLIVKKRRGA